MTVWARDLLGLWVSRDLAGGTQPLGYPSVSSGFGLATEETSESEDTAGYSSAELQAMSDGVSWLSTEHPDHWRALSLDCMPWRQRNLQSKPGDHALVSAALQLLADFVDNRLQ